MLGNNRDKMDIRTGGLLGRAGKEKAELGKKGKFSGRRTRQKLKTSGLNVLAHRKDKRVYREREDYFKKRTPHSRDVSANKSHCRRT